MDIRLCAELALKLMVMEGCCLNLASDRLVVNCFKGSRVGPFKRSGGYMTQYFCCSFVLAATFVIGSLIDI